MGGGGGGDGFEARQQQTEDKKQRARDQLNVLFGQGGSTTGKPQAVDREQFYRPIAQQDVMAGVEAVERPGARFAGGYGGEGESAATSGFGGSPGFMFDQNAFGAAEAQAQAAADAEAAKIGQNRGAREGLYQTVRDNAFTSGRRRLDEDKQDAGRKLKFSLFAQGLNGGSEDVDQNALLGRTYQQGVMDLGAKADAAKAQFRSDDENTRLQLLQSIDAGMDEGSALSSAASRMQVAADRAAADANGVALGNVFDTAGLLYENSQASRGRQAGQEWWNTYSAPGGRRAGSNPTGVTTRLPGE